MIQLALAILFSLFTFLLNAQSLKIILDTDIDSDVDDVGALAMLHTYADHGKVEILGVIVTTENKFAPSCTDAINTFFNRPHIPIGVQKGISFQNNSKYTRQISEEFPHDLLSYDAAEDATHLYRKLLASQPDSSVVIVTIGHLTNLRNLLESKPDQVSELSGMDLVKRKVRLWSCMGGMYPEGKEANFYRPDPESTKICVDNWPGRVVFSGWELGNKIITGGDFLKKTLSPESPVWRAYQLYNDFQGRASWDQASLLYAISSSNNYWDLQEEGYCLVAEDGSNKWVEDNDKNQAYLLEKIDPIEVSKIIDALMTGIFSENF
ncbi:hypothetical protein BH23BAC1_BH23BAC1_08460 [soil metagenome]